jgi:hypothetical protein
MPNIFFNGVGPLNHSKFNGGNSTTFIGVVAGPVADIFAVAVLSAFEPDWAPSRQLAAINKVSEAKNMEQWLNLRCISVKIVNAAIYTY